jgi:hypothetical protein
VDILAEPEQPAAQQEDGAAGTAPEAVQPVTAEVSVKGVQGWGALVCAGSFSRGLHCSGKHIASSGWT